MLLKGATKEQAFHIGKDIVDTVTATNPKPVKLKFEKVWFSRIYNFRKSLKFSCLSTQSGIQLIDKSDECFFVLALTNHTEAAVWSTNHMPGFIWFTLAILLYAASSPGAAKSHFVAERRGTGSVGLDGLAAKGVHQHAPRSNQRETPGDD